jgi:hypothetical protein
MARKVRRVRKKKGPQDSGTVGQAESFQDEYAYVIQDLRRVLFVSGVMFLLLIILNLFLQ